MNNARTPAALALCAAVSAALLTGCGSVASGQGAPRTAASPADVVSPAAAPAGHFGPTGYGGIRLGMPLAKVRATGATLIDPVGGWSGCTRVRSKGSTLPAGESDITLSPAQTVADISADASAVTPEGIRLGSPKATVLAAWPQAKEDPDFWDAPVPGNPKAQIIFGFDSHGRLAGMTLTTIPRDDCAN